MSGNSTSDCYLCGATNDADASFCERCNGQLLQLPPVIDDDYEETEVEAETPPVEETPEPTPEVSKPKRLTRKGTVQDQRLSDALGLSEVIEVPDVPEHDEGSLVDTVVTSIPRATPSADIPIIGTRAGAVPQSAIGEREFGKKTFVLLALLLLGTAWFGYSTFTKDRSNEPDSIAFTGTTAAPNTTTTTTEKPRRQWQQNEVDARYKSTFVRVDLYACPAPVDPPPKKPEPVEPVASSLGVAISTHNVLVDARPAPGADVAVISSRTGATRVALLAHTADGAFIATSTRATSRNLALGEPSNDPLAFFVAYDPETNVVTTSTQRQNASAEIAVTGTGDARTVFFAGQGYPTSSLIAVDTRLEPVPDVELPRSPTVCQEAQALQEVGTVADGEDTDEAAEDEIDPSSPDGAEQEPAPDEE